MNCFPCCGPKKSNSKREHGSPPPELVTGKNPDMKKQKAEEQNQADPGNIQAQAFSFRELATATKNFRQECLIDEGGFGRIYKGIIPSTGQLVAVKQLDRNGIQSSKEFLAEVAELSLLHHENLVNLIGYCADGDQRLLVYELFASRTLENRLFGFLSAPPPPPAHAPVPKKSDVAESERESDSEGESESGSDAISRKGSRRSSLDKSQHDYCDSSHLPPVVSSKPSRKSSTRSSKGKHSSESGDGVSVSSISSKSSRKSRGDLSQKSSRKSSVEDLSQQKSSKKSSVEDLSQHKSSRKSSSTKDLSQKSSRKSSVEDLSQHKSSRKSSSTKDLSQKSSRKSSIRKPSSRVLSHKSNVASEDGSISSSCRSSSVGSEDEGVRSERSSMRLSQGSYRSDPYGSRRTEDESMNILDRATSIGSDEDSGHPFDQTSSSGGSSVYSR
ncbi:hypothetical protein JHK82_028407 [Glycine max]|nr:hypothetical protein JHK85_029078 [Glycine max]KAG5004392.1 hypothetical protein JHK86_028531 [Glycine max]KAG5127572.1 hypothetical protein JHK82_028407 [Glycine max]